MLNARARIRRRRTSESSSNQPTAGRLLPWSLPTGQWPLPRLEPAKSRTVILLGREWHGIPDGQVEAADVCVEIPMVGQGASVNVAVAANLVLYRLAEMA